MRSEEWGEDGRERVVSSTFMPSSMRKRETPCAPLEVSVFAHTMHTSQSQPLVMNTCARSMHRVFGSGHWVVALGIGHWVIGYRVVGSAECTLQGFNVRNQHLRLDERSGAVWRESGSWGGRRRRGRLGLDGLGFDLTLDGMGCDEPVGVGE